MAISIIKKKQKFQYDDPITHTLNPIVTGSSVIGLQYNGGVIVASDTLISYGSSAKFRDVQRIEQLNNFTLISSSGEFSDFQEVVKKLKEMSKEEYLQDDNIKFSPREYGNYLARLNYARRNKFNPNYINSVIAGYQNGQPYLATVDLYGTYIEESFALTGMADYMCKPIVTNNWSPQKDQNVARAVISQCFTNLFYRDCRASDKIQFAVIDANGFKLEEPVQVGSIWNIKGYNDRANEKLHAQ